jgi:hypothetical protein
MEIGEILEQCNDLIEKFMQLESSNSSPKEMNLNH